MRTLPSALLPYSIESFFSEEEIASVLQSIDAYKASTPRSRLQAGANGISVHENPALSMKEIVAVYEPAGRLEINAHHIPRDVIDIVERAFYRHIEDIRRAYPESQSPRGITYVEYTIGQFFTAHIDGMNDGHIAGFGVTLTNDFEGGEFIIQTCGSNRLWAYDEKDQLTVAPNHDASSEWFRSLPKTEWITRPKYRNAIFYGNALTHGSKPVTKGVLKKLLAFIH